MAGIYIHIPFCRQKCYYCDFYKTVNSAQINPFVSSLINEIKQRNNFLNNQTVSTLYFGGGTPSVLKEKEIQVIFEQLRSNFNMEKDAEITFEANPDDLNSTYLKMLKRNGINRLSIGIQSFQEEHLKRMNRRHSAEQSVASVIEAVNAGFKNISIDLIYGLPKLSDEQWKESLQKCFELPVDHLSAYHLTYHEGTPFYTWLKKGTLKELKETASVKQFNILMDMAGKANFEHYEISNFAKNQMYSRHNSSYWKGITYLGLGPSSHSFNGKIRCWNVAHLETYLKAMAKNTKYWEEEVLTENDKFNEYIITRIRTKWGISLPEIERLFGPEKALFLKENLRKYINSGKITGNKENYKLSKEGLFVSDGIIAGLMII